MGDRTISLDALERLPAADLIKWAASKYPKSFAVVTSFQSEGMVLLDMAARVLPSVRVVTIDTGRLPQTTLQMIDTIRERYGVAVEVVDPDPAEVAAMVSQHGRDLFYREVPLRLICCEIRKVRPLERKLRELDAWAVGLRRSQAESRGEVRKVEDVDGRLKLSPLADWTVAQVESYVLEHDVPRHPLYALGYTSIGCDPCTRAVEAGEEERAGRWWWEEGTPKECGLHFSPNGNAERKVDVLLREIVQTPHG